jgi:SAM-dependent methyltransferase
LGSTTPNQAPRDQSAIGARSRPRTIGTDHRHRTGRDDMAAPDDATTTTTQRHGQALGCMEELYIREAERLEAINGPFGELMLAAAGLQPGQRVLDVGCGQGTTTLRAAQAVAPGGAAVGVDISAPLVALARQRASAAGIGNAEFVQADAQTHPFQERGFDAVISRFGTMFFQDADAAFANLGRAVRPGGRLALVCPHDPSRTEWVAVAFAAAAPHVGIPDLGPPGAPGPFAFADGDRLRRVLEAGGFRDVALQAVTRPVRMGDDAEDVTAFIASLPEARQLFAGKPQAKVAAAIDALREGLAPYQGTGGVVMDETAWLATARR